MISPSLSLGLTLGLLYGAASHLVIGGDGRRLLFLVIASCIGFALGQAFGQIFAIGVASVGPTQLLSGSFGSLVAVASFGFLVRRVQRDRF